MGKKKEKSRSKPKKLPEDQQSKASPLLARGTWITALLISVITLLLYLPALQNNFVNWDDADYVFENSHIRSLDLSFLKWSFGFHSSNWHPLTWLSHAIDYSLWGLKAKGHHLSSVILHSINTFLLSLFVSFLLLKTKIPETSFFTENKNSLSMVLIASGVTALLFGIHPVHVESVAWVSERKDVLTTLFILISLIFYVRHVSGHAQNKPTINYLCSLFFFTLALMSKPMAVTLPVLLVILDIYPFQRLTLNKNIIAQKKILVEKIPFFFLSLISVVLTIFAQLYGGAVRTTESFPLVGRIEIAIKGLCFYILKMIFPVGLSPYYPYPKKISFLSPEYMISAIVVILITVFCIWAWRKGWKVFAIIGASYVVTLLPVLGIIQIGGQAAADRYTYIPGIGIFLLIGFGTAHIWEKITQNGQSLMMRRTIFVLLFIVIFGLLGRLTVKQIGVWKDSITLWTSVLERFPDYEGLYINRSAAYVSLGNYKKAIEDLDKAITLKPDFVEAYINRGAYYFKSGDHNSAINSYTGAIELFPEHEELYHNRAVAYLMIGDFKNGLKDLDRSIELNPKFFDAHLNRCQAYVFLNNFQQAIDECSKAIEINPEDDRTIRPRKSYIINLADLAKPAMRYDIVHYIRGVAYFNQGDIFKAFQDLDKAIELNPKFFEAYTARGVTFVELGKLENAIEDFNKAISLNPQYPDAYYNRGSIYFKKGKQQEAINDFQRAARLGDKKAQEFLKSRGIAGGKIN